MIETEIDKRIEALAEYLEISPAKITYNGDEKEFPNPWDTYSSGRYYEYLVVTDDEATELLEDVITGRVRDGSILDFFDIKYLMDFVAQDWFEDACREDCENYAYDGLSDEEVVDECLNIYGLIDESDLNEDEEYEGDIDDLREDLAEAMFDRHESDYHGVFSNWYSDIFGSFEVERLIREGYVSLDEEALIDYVCRYDERETYLGEEGYQDGYYIYER